MDNNIPDTPAPAAMGWQFYDEILRLTLLDEPLSNPSGAYRIYLNREQVEELRALLATQGSAEEPSLRDIYREAAAAESGEPRPAFPPAAATQGSEPMIEATDVQESEDMGLGYFSRPKGSEPDALRERLRKQNKELRDALEMIRRGTHNNPADVIAARALTATPEEPR